MTRVLVSFPGLHRVHRGAEVALEAVADGLAKLGDDVRVVGSGPPIPERRYSYRSIGVVDRERFARAPSIPLLRDPSSYESLLFNARLSVHPGLRDVDVTLSAGFPWDNLALRRPSLRGRRPPHVFVTENGDWPALVDRGDARLFGCDGLVCTNPLYLERNADRHRCALIPNGVDLETFQPGPADRPALGLPVDRPIVLMVSALIESKRVDDGIRAVAELDDDVVLVVAGTGPEKPALDRLGQDLLGDRYVNTTFAHPQMPLLYRAADVVLHLTHIESFGNVYVEALASGIPVVAHRSPVTEWIFDDARHLVDSDDRAALVAGIDAALRSNPQRDALRINATSRFSWSVVAAQYQDFLREIAT